MHFRLNELQMQIEQVKDEKERVSMQISPLKSHKHDLQVKCQDLEKQIDIDNEDKKKLLREIEMLKTRIIKSEGEESRLK